MEEKLVLQIILGENNAVMIEMGEASEMVSPMTLVGILEQVKHSIFENMRVEKVSRSSKSYDA
jgi:hypothetical protein